MTQQAKTLFASQRIRITRQSLRLITLCSIASGAIEYVLIPVIGYLLALTGSPLVLRASLGAFYILMLSFTPLFLIFGGLAALFNATFAPTDQPRRKPLILGLAMIALGCILYAARIFLAVVALVITVV